MLADHPVEVILLEPDLAEAREFYADKVGLDILREEESAVTFRCGGGTRITISASTSGTADEQTQASWVVEDLPAELKELRSRGVEILEYDTPAITTHDGIFDAGEALHAWFMDPGKNTLGIDQRK
jgi:extradiol dioxygenase family protein